jgi:hypothetical protein
MKPCRTPAVRRDHWQRRIAQLDPDVDFAEIYRIMAAHEFPWDVMHGFASYSISNDDMRYVQSTFVVIPLRWLDRFGWRAPTEAERRASANYYRELGRHMNIKDSPGTHEEFAAYLDAYERDHFAYSPGGRGVADATLALLASFYPAPLRARALVERRLPARRKPVYARDLPEFAIYPDGYGVEELGTFP